MAQVRELSAAAEAGDRQAGNNLFLLVYDDLRRLAGHYLTGERLGQTLQPTALVHEAYLRLAGDVVGEPAGAHWDGRGHLFAACAEAMRRILVEAARRKARHKRGGNLTRVPLDPDLVASPKRAEELLTLDEALTDLGAAEPRVAKLVTLRYFGGLTVDDAAAALGVSPRTAAADWAYARAWLQARVEGEERAE
ncbi:MAG: ECF-type sigma factor [Pirellulaceae bacterium]